MPQDLQVEEIDGEETYSATSLLIVTETRTELWRPSFRESICVQNLW